MKLQFRSCGPWLAILALTLVSAPAFAQVPQDTTFTGRLVDSLGNPLVGPTDLALTIFNADMGGTALYFEKHLDVPLDATGGFSVQLGLGAGVVGTFDADLFSGVDRWLEVAVGAEVLTPRQIIGSVPWALVAERANEVVRDPNAGRFEDCGDGTVADHQTGLQWEKKAGTLFLPVDCDTTVCPNPHVVNNRYRWSITAAYGPDGNAFTDFLARLNGNFDPNVPTGCFAGHCDWELPEISELQTILIGPEAAPGQALTCSATPCIDPDFAAVGGPTGWSGGYWSVSPSPFAPPAYAWEASFEVSSSGVWENPKLGSSFVRAVRTGSCN